MSSARHQCWNHPETGTIVSNGLCQGVYFDLTNTYCGLALKYGPAILQSLRSFLQHESVSHLKECRLRGGGSFQGVDCVQHRDWLQSAARGIRNRRTVVAPAFRVEPPAI